MSVNNKRIDISFNENDIKRNRKLGETGIFYNKNFTPTDFILFLSKIFEELDLNKEEFEFRVEL